MQDYNFWADLLFTFQSSPDWIKALWLLVPPGFVLAVMAMVTRFGLALRRRGTVVEGEIVVPVRYRSEGMLRTTDKFDLLSEFQDLLPLLPSGEKMPDRADEGDEERKRRMS